MAHLAEGLHFSWFPLFLLAIIRDVAIASTYQLCRT